MNKFKFYFILIFSGLLLFSCKKDDDSTEAVPLRDYATQYATEKANIETYMRTHYIKSITDAPGSTSDMNIEIDTLLASNTTAVSLWYNTAKDSIKKDFNDITYTMYFLKLRTGDATQDAPSRVDRVLAAYDGSYLTSTNAMKRFEYTPFPTAYLGLDEAILGWAEVFPKFNPGTSVSTPGEPTIYNNFGAGIMFIPSGLAYYNYATSTIPSYASLMFTFKFYKMQRADQDGDGILSIDEDLNHNGIFTDDDTDADGIPNYADADDDGDGTGTRAETKIPNSVPAAYYPYSGALVDDPATTTIDESLGVPSCSGDFKTDTRLRKYLDPECH